jgi:hypothetical protein
MLSHPIVSQHFMEPEGSIPNSLELSTYSYPEPDQSSPHHPIFSLNITITILDITHPPVFYLKFSLSKTGLCSVLQVKLTQFGPTEPGS